jgi:hypothetical protein
VRQFRHHRIGFIRALSDVDTAADYAASRGRGPMHVVRAAA